MVLRKSEYFDKFQSLTGAKNQDIYQENVQIRTERRDREFVHTPICWGEEEEEGSQKVGELSIEDKEYRDPKKAEKQKQNEEDLQYQTLGDILFEAREKASAFRRRKSETKTIIEAEKINIDKINTDSCTDNEGEKKLMSKSIPLSDVVLEENRKLNKRLADSQESCKAPTNTERRIPELDLDCEEEIPPSKHCSGNLRRKEASPVGRCRTALGKKSDKSSTVVLRSKSSLDQRGEKDVNPNICDKTRVRRPDRQAKIPRASSRSRPRTSQSTTSVEAKPPFVSYGSGDKEQCLTTHRTYNVKAPCDVYKTAIRAKQRREADRQRQVDLEKKAKDTQALLDKLLMAKKRSEFDWATEYQKQFHGYEPREYERSVSSRAYIPRSQAVRAVNRGGCLVINVD